MENKFGYFDLGGAQIMLLEDTNRPIYQMHRAGPNGKGLHFQVEIPSISGILERLDKTSVPLASDVVESWYRQDTLLHGQREFFVADPDGYLYRFYEYIGERIVPNSALQATCEGRTRLRADVGAHKSDEPITLHDRVTHARPHLVDSRCARGD